MWPRQFPLLDDLALDTPGIQLERNVLVHIRAILPIRRILHYGAAQRLILDLFEVFLSARGFREYVIIIVSAPIYSMSGCSIQPFHLFQ